MYVQDSKWTWFNMHSPLHEQKIKVIGGVFFLCVMVETITSMLAKNHCWYNYMKSLFRLIFRISLNQVFWFKISLNQVFFLEHKTIWWHPAEFRPDTDTFIEASNQYKCIYWPHFLSLWYLDILDWSFFNQMIRKQ